MHADLYSSYRYFASVRTVSYSKGSEVKLSLNFPLLLLESCARPRQQ